MIEFQKEFIELNFRNLFQTADEWLKHCIGSYIPSKSIIESENGLIIHGDVTIKYIHTQLPVNIDRVHGNFDLSGALNLKTLKNCPRYVSYAYDTSGFSFEDLEYGPVGVKSLYVKSLKSFKYLPKQCETLKVGQIIPPKHLLNIFNIENIEHFSLLAGQTATWSDIISAGIKSKMAIYEVAAKLIEEDYSDDIVSMS